ncbi:glycine cleavage system H protein [Dethiosulfatibacter aminovorans DSM 17477]|uniref:Glycine cleavage system H protein n=1 Tax=Dethiosulfatibacter aminovorans DSM 17477 TaxID=1121476 RepID=A0A1M6ED25_9FIRM|nr:glycine cleavage system protein GcvH [Dethiosulfatibacter aminovorans]SHI83289.1 glycine cleavage system H protein [Dethiosulfatibacter aminovorans DSM 17477]
MTVKEGLYYTQTHEWVRVEEEEAYVGLSDYAQHALGDIVYVELPEIGEEFGAADSFGAIESVKAASDIYLPLSGEVIEVNEELEEQPELINEDAYENWIAKIKVNDATEVEELMNPEQYEEYIEGLEEAEEDE